MKRFFRVGLWALVSVAALVVLLAIGLGVYARTEHFRRLVQMQLIDAVNDSIRGTVSLEGIEGTLWSNIVLRDLRVRDDDGEIAHLPRVKISYSWHKLLRGQWEATRVEADEPVVRLARDRGGRWNIAEAFSSDSQEPSELAVLLKEIVLRQSKLDVSLAGAEPQAYHLTGLDLTGQLAIEPGKLSVDIREISSRLAMPELPELNVKGALGYQDASSSPSLTMTDLRVASGASRIKLNGEIRDFEKPKLQGTVALEKLAAPDVIRFVPEWPFKHDLTGTVDLTGGLDALRAGIKLAMADARLSGRLDLNLAQETPRFEGKFKVAGADARKLLELEDIAGVVSGDVEVKGTGAALAAMEARGTLTIRSTEAAGWTLGDAKLNARLRRSVVSLDGELNGAMGGADWRGRITLAKIPRYEMDLAVRDLDVKKVAPDEGTIDGRLNLNARIKGAGIKIPDLNTQAEIEILPSSVGPVELQKSRISASFADGRIRIARGALRTADTTLVIKGDIGVDLKQRGTLDYELRAQSLSPWLSLVGRKGAGSMTLKGRARGNLTALETEGKATLAGLLIDGVALNNGAIAFDLTREGEQSLPAGTVRAALAGFQSGILLRKVDLALELKPDGPDMIRIEAKAQDEWNRAHALSGDIGWHQNEVIARVRALSLELPDGTWKLVQPATLKKSGDEFFLEKIALQNGAKDLTIDGHAAVPGKQALSLRLRGFPLEALAAFLPEQPKMTGILTAQAQVGGTAAAPEITAAAELRDSTIGGQTYAGVVADFSYDNSSARANLTVRQDATHTLSATGSLPLALSWHDGWRSEVAGAMDVRVQSAGLSLAFLNAYSGKSVADVGGDLMLDMRARGSIKEPELLGTFRLRGGKLKAIPLGLNITDIAAEGSVGSRSIGIQSLSARAAEGKLNGKGALALKNYQAENLTLSLAFNKWPAIYTRRYRVETDGNIAIEGNLTAPKVTGEIKIVEASLRPDLDFLEKGAAATKRDETIVVVKRKDTDPTRANNAGAKDQPGESALLKQTSLDIVLRMPGNVWVRHPDAVAELRGNFRVLKKAHANIDLTGAAEIVRGWVGFQGRRFDLSRGRIEFIGGDKINPALDIVARQRLPQYTVEALVGGTAENPTLTLRSQPQLDQADILALLLFGKPIKDLNRGEQVSLQQSARGLASGYVAGQIANSISAALGLDSLGIDVGNVDFSGGKIGFGRYVGRDTYVTMSQELAGERGREVGVEYQLAPDWKLGSSTDTRGSSGIDIIWSKQY